MAEGDEDSEFKDTMRYATSAIGKPVTDSLPPTLLATLHVVQGANKGAVYEISKVATVIGRGAMADIRLEDQLLSRLHVLITFNGNEFRIMDNESENGTFLNGSLVKEYRLRDGDKVLAGETLFRFQITMR